jgi:hypothetical protein
MSLIQTLQVLLIGDNPTGQVRLEKRPQQNRWTISRKIEAFIARHFYLIMVLFMLILLVAFVIVCFAIVGASATDSGVTYNAMEQII